MRWFVAVVCWSVLASIGAPSSADEGDRPAKGLVGPSAPQESSPVVLEIDATPEPVPALKYRLLPPQTDLRPGNAATIYLRPRHEKNDEWNTRLVEECERLLDLPREQVKQDEVDELLQRYRYVLSQLEVAARRKDCDWEYLYGEDGQAPEAFLLPDLVQMRIYARLLAAQVRGDVVAGRFDEAVHSVQTGLAFARHVSNAPFLVNRLVGAATAILMLDELQGLITQPGAPNLYWALAALPRPLIDVRASLDYERDFLLYKFPELRTLDQPRTPEQWTQLETHMHDSAVQMFKELEGLQWSSLWDASEPASVDDARAFLTEHSDQSAEQVASMSDSEVKVRYSLLAYRYFYDLSAKNAFRPVLTNDPDAGETTRRLAVEQVKEVIPLARFLVPAIESAMPAQWKLDRQVAALQTVEALSLFASAHDGELPAQLDELDPPAPSNPLEGLPFVYSRKSADSAGLKAPGVRGLGRSRLDWQINVRPFASKR